MERFSSLEILQHSPELLLKKAQEHALPYEIAKDLIDTIEQLTNESGDPRRIAELKRTLDDSTITVQTLSEFKALLEKTGHNSLLLQEVLEKGERHGTMAEQVGAHHEGYTLLVMKDGDDFRYKAEALYSHLTKLVQQPVLLSNTTQITAPNQRIAERVRKDEKEIERIRTSLRS